jgi:hypothetical protein
MGDEVELKPGTRLRSAVSDTEVIVIKPPSDAVALSCGGALMRAASDESPVTETAADDTVTMVGKRYEHEGTGLVVLCTKGGAGALSIGDAILTIEVSRALPSSD